MGYSSESPTVLQSYDKCDNWLDFDKYKIKTKTITDNETLFKKYAKQFYSITESLMDWPNFIDLIKFRDKNRCCGTCCHLTTRKEYVPKGDYFINDIPHCHKLGQYGGDITEPATQSCGKYYKESN